MAGRARPTRFLRAGKTRRETMWLPGALASTTIAGVSTAVLVGSLNAAALALRPFTIVRVRGRLHMRSDQLIASENWGASYGLAVVSEQASAIGVTAIPTPDTDRGSDLFFVYEEYHGRLERTANGLLEGGFGWGFDSKAMRKVYDDQDLVTVVETSAIDSSCVLLDAFRFLIKLH